MVTHRYGRNLLAEQNQYSSDDGQAARLLFGLALGDPGDPTEAKPCSSGP